MKPTHLKSLTAFAILLALTGCAKKDLPQLPPAAGEGAPASTLGRFVSDADDARHGKAERRAARRRYLASREGLKRRALLVAIPIAIVFVINILTWSTPSNFWFQWPTLGFLIAFALRTAWVTRR